MMGTVQSQQKQQQHYYQQPNLQPTAQSSSSSSMRQPQSQASTRRSSAAASSSLPSSASSSSLQQQLFWEQEELQEMAQTDQWMSLSSEVEFLPSHRLLQGGGIEYLDDAQLRHWAAQQIENRHERQLSSKSSSSLSQSASAKEVYKLSPFVEGESEYDEYQQAWRLLGFMIDCDDVLSNTDDDYDYNGDNMNNNNDDGNGGSGSGDGTGYGCHRYVIWAAYVDLDYQGGGIGEYQYWDRSNERWNDVPCTIANSGDGDSRCAKMDCHLSDTNWSLLGMFKHKSLDDWMEQLFKHEGVCVWGEEQYEFMSDAREAWPDDCMGTGKKANSGASIYYGTKPISGGKITIGLYTDPRCVEEYQSQGSDDPMTVEYLVGNILADGGSGDNADNNGDDMYSSFENSLAYWNNALDAFRICQPCVAYDVYNYGYNADDDASRGENYGAYRYGYDDDYRYNYYVANGNGQGNDFDCYDDADYTNVNQCMKFMAKTEMNTASFRDIMLATAQGTLTDNPLNGYMNSKNQRWIKRSRNSTSSFSMWFWFICSVLFVGYGYRSFARAQRNTNYRLPKLQMNLKQPLVYETEH